MSGFPAQPARNALETLAAARDLTVTDLARTLGVDRSTLHRLYRRNTLRYDAADHIAIALGRHPYELWPEWFQAQDVPATRRTASGVGCRQTLLQPASRPVGGRLSKDAA